MPVGDEAAKPGAGKRYNHHHQHHHQHHHHHYHHTIVVVVVIAIIIVVVVILIAVIIIRDFKQRRFRPRTSTGSRLFAKFGSVFALIFGQVVSITA